MTTLSIRSHRDERGSALLALLIAATLGVLVIGGLTTSMIETQLADRGYRAAQAFYQAEAGYQHAYAALGQTAAGVDDDLKGADMAAGTADDGYVLGMAPVELGDGDYIARLVDNDDGDGDPMVDSDSVVYLWVRGRARDAERAVRVTIRGSASAGLPPGVYANGDIDLSGQNNIAGPSSRIHANGDLLISGQSQLTGEASAAGNAIADKGSNYNGSPINSDADVNEFKVKHGQRDPVEIPPVDPHAYQHLADYRLTADGRVLNNRTGALVADLVNGSGNSWNGWSLGTTDKNAGSERIWKMKEVPGTAATVFVEGSAYVDAAVRKGDHSVAVASIIATADIAFSGNAEMRGHNEDFLMVAGGDVKLTGDTNASQFFGTVYVHEQFKMAGTAALEGSIVVENAEDQRSIIFTDQTEGVSMSGSAKIKLGGKGPNVGGNKAAMVTDWYEDSTGQYRSVFR